MDLFKDIKKGKFGNDKKLKREAKHELKELGGEKRAKVYEKAIKSKMKLCVNYNKGKCVCG